MTEVVNIYSQICFRKYKCWKWEKSAEADGAVYLKNFIVSLPNETIVCLPFRRAEQGIVENSTTAEHVEGLSECCP